MNKRILLSLLIVSPAFVHAMENDSCSSLNQIQTSKNEFESKLQIEKWTKRKKTYMELVTLSLFSTNEITPVRFLQYCYYYKELQENKFEANLNELNAYFLKKCQKAQIDGYSALGAAMIAKETSIERKREFIQQLIKCGFKPTPKDIELEKLILYEEITKQSKPMLHMLYSPADWSVLPQEIRKWITRYMIQLFKNERLLPGTPLNNF